MHLDMDAFFASVEQRDHPAYQGLPLVVGAAPGKRGVVATCSYEARRFGIHSAMPIAEAYRRCPGAVYLRPDMERYSAASRAVFQALADISPLVEPVSVDEAYLDISGMERLIGSPREIALRTKARVWHAVGLRCSIGVGPNRLIAKLASEAGKPDGLRIVSHDQVLGFLDPLPVSALRGVGKQTEKIVDRLGIRSVRQLRGYSLTQLQRHFGAKGGRSLYDQARGMASDQVGVGKGRQSISKETTFNEDQGNPEEIDSALVRLSAEVGRITRAKQLKGRTVSLKLRLADFETHTRQRRLREGINTDTALLRAARALYEASGFTERPLRLIGIGLSDWTEEPRMGDLFAEQPKDQQEERLFETLDAINERFGDSTLSRGLRPRGR